MSSTMAPNSVTAVRKAINGKRKFRPTWEMADYFPMQGQWTEDEYLDLPEDGPRAELVDGFLELLPMPSIQHQRIAKFLFLKLNAFVETKSSGEVLYDGTRIKLGERRIRLPDILVVLKEKQKQHTKDYFLGADLVVEVVSESPKDRKRDLVEKRARYAEAKISEYWIADPELGRIVVLKLVGDSYDLHGEFLKGQIAKSALLKGFEVDVTEALAGMKR